MSDKKLVARTYSFSDNGFMRDIKDSEIYPKFEFRLTHTEKNWLVHELDQLKEKFSSNGQPVTKNDLLVAALRHGFRYLHKREKICEKFGERP